MQIKFKFSVSVLQSHCSLAIFWKRVCYLEEIFANIDIMIIMATLVAHCSKRNKSFSERMKLLQLSP